MALVGARVGRPPAHEGKLALWIEEAGKTRQDVADELGISRPFLDHICREYRRPGFDLAVKIERLTKGKVSIAYLVEACLASRTTDRTPSSKSDRRSLNILPLGVYCKGSGKEVDPAVGRPGARVRRGDQHRGAPPSGW